MPVLRETSALGVAQPNALEEIRRRAVLGQVPWTGPLLLVVARPSLLVVVQGLVALLLWFAHRPDPWRAAGDWWQVYSSLVDAGCLLGLRFFTRREHIRMRDLIGEIRLRKGHDLWVGLSYFAAVFPLFLLASYGARRWLYGASGQNPNAFLIHGHALPVWATVYSLTLWWVIWSPTEESTYQAYVLPRLEALSGRTWLAVLIVTFFWTVQHCALPLILDVRFVVFRFLMFFPGVLLLVLIYVRTRRVAPLIIAHWPMDIAGAVMGALL